jgi:competence protein ComEA
MLRRLSKKIGLTTNELKIFGFIITAFLVGLVYSNFFNKKVENPYLNFDYTDEDKKFFSSDNDSLVINQQKRDNKEVDYKQEVLDFNAKNFNNIQKKSLPAEKSINLNSAKLEELVNLPGIGSKTAEKIIEYRQLHKKFRNINELLNVKGIGESKLNKIKNYIYID